MSGTRQYAVLGPLTSGVENRAFLGCEVTDGEPRPDLPVVVVWLPNDVTEDKRQVARLQRETAFVTQLDHPHVIGVHGLECFDEGWARVVDFADGEPLHQITKSAADNFRPIEPRMAARIVLDVSSGVRYAHEEGQSRYAGRPIVHGGIRPDTIILTFDGRAVLTGYGAAVLNPNQSNVPPNRLVYLAPEQIIGGKATASPATDIYGLGCVLYELLTGHAPYAREEDIERAILTGEPPLIDVDGLTGRLGNIAATALAKRGADRFESVEVFEDAIKKALSDDDVEASSQEDLAAFVNAVIPPDAPERTARTEMLESAREEDAVSVLSRPESAPAGFDANLFEAARPAAKSEKLRTPKPRESETVVEEPREPAARESSTVVGPRTASADLPGFPESSTVQSKAEAPPVTQQVAAADIASSEPSPSSMVSAQDPQAYLTPTPGVPSSPGPTSPVRAAPTNPAMQSGLPQSSPPAGLPAPQAHPPAYNTAPGYPQQQHPQQPGAFAGQPPPSGMYPQQQHPQHPGAFAGQPPPSGMYPPQHQHPPPQQHQPPPQQHQHPPPQQHQHPPQQHHPGAFAGQPPPSGMYPAQHQHQPPGAFAGQPPPSGMHPAQPGYPPPQQTNPNARAPVGYSATGGPPPQNQMQGGLPPRPQIPADHTAMGMPAIPGGAPLPSAVPTPQAMHAQTVPPQATAPPQNYLAAANQKSTNEATGLMQPAGLPPRGAIDRSGSVITQFNKRAGDSSRAILFLALAAMVGLILFVILAPSDTPEGLDAPSERHRLPPELVQEALNKTKQTAPVAGVSGPSGATGVSGAATPPPETATPSAMENFEPPPPAGPGKLTLRTEPSVTVYKGKEILGRTPLTLTLPAGIHKLRLSDKKTGLNKYRTYRVHAEGHTKDKLTFGKGKVVVLAPDGAQVTLNSRNLGKAPIEPVSVYEGGYLLRVSLDGMSWHERFEVGPGQTVEYKVRLQPR